MIYLLFSIFSSVAVGILFKQIKPTLAESFLMITINYIVAMFLSYSFFEINISNLNVDITIILPLIILMPTIFYILNLSINKSGIIKTDISQRISLIIPISASFLIFGESISILKWIGIILGFTSVVLMLYKTNSEKKTNSIFLLIVFIGYGIIDILFKQIALQNTIPFTTYLFFIFSGSFSISLLITFFVNRNIKSINKKVFIYGLFLGILNFSNIYFYLKAHKIFSDNPSTVFAIMNFGVISLATFLGVLLFKEKLSKKNIIGIILAVFAIIFVVYSQYKNL